MIYWISHGLFTIFSKLLFPVKVHGLKNIPSRGGFILASNHLSNLDPMLLGIASGRRLNYLAKESLFKNWFFSFFLYQVGAFPIKRGSSDVGAIKEALKRLKRGGGMVIFPEGTRRKTKDGTKSVQPGIGLVAAKSGVPVIPAFILNSEKVMPTGSKFIKPARITVSFGKPAQYSMSQSYYDVAQNIMDEIDSLSNFNPSGR